jgi:hypothetical protein
MLRKILFAGATVACVAAMLTGCSKKNPAEPEDETPTAPSGATLVFAEGFGGDLSEWDNDYMVDMFHIYPRMRTTTDAAHTGTHALTTDSNNTALLFSLLPADRIESGIAGVQFYIMAKELGQANFTVEIGANAGSSGGVQPAFGIGFDPSDSIKCTYYDMYYPYNNGYGDSLLCPFELNRWYKCAVEANFSDSTITYYLDDVLVRTFPLDVARIMGIDKLLVFRGMNGAFGLMDASAEGPKQYYADDIVFYKK